MKNELQVNIQKLMEKDMNRKEFLAHVGIAFAGIFGIAALIKTVGQLGGSSTERTSSLGYGSSAYGGSGKE